MFQLTVRTIAPCKAVIGYVAPLRFDSLERQAVSIDSKRTDYSVFIVITSGSASKLDVKQVAATSPRKGA